MDKYNEYTPMIRQYLGIKENYKDALLFFRLGDFYEMFFNDAIVASRELEIALTKKSAGNKNKIPMCGVPHHSVNNYIEKLVEIGYKVAICDQVEEADASKGIVKREVVNIVTPGTNVSVLNDKENNYIVCVTEHSNTFSLCYSDLSTGEINVTKIEKDIDFVASEILLLNAKEIIVNKDFKNEYILKLSSVYNIMITYFDEVLIPFYMENLVSNINDKEMLLSIGNLLNYIIHTQKRELLHLQKVKIYTSKDYLRIDIHSSRNLEILETLRTNSKKGTLNWLLDKCSTAMGSRNLKKWLQRPSIDNVEINNRLDLVQELMEEFERHEEIKESLKKIYDFERIVGKLSYGRATARDLIQLKSSLSVIPDIKLTVGKLNSKFSKQFSKEIDTHDEIFDLIEKSIKDNPSISINEGNIIKKGYDEELDVYLDSMENGNKYISEIEKREIEKTKINNLKIKFNKVFGYFIEITKSNISRVKEEFNYIRKQTLSNCERYITTELKEQERIILSAEDKSFKLEKELFMQIREDIKLHSSSLQKLAKIVAIIDTLSSFATLSKKNFYVRPIFNNDKILKITNGRHPVMEKIADNFVENSIDITKNQNLLLLTGPNMSGKSTYMRQNAIIVLMAQIGCFVPCECATLPITDQIFTRIGSSDDLVSGKSTFMVEMLETNNALANATENSLILFDEIGRGTSTFDGMAIAQSIIEYIHKNINCPTIFSTHYHELCELELNLNKLKNIHVDAKKTTNEIIFMHKVKEGKSNDSYGINVANLANLPKELISRAKVILKKLENNKIQDNNLFNITDYREENIVEETVKKDNKNDEIKNMINIIDINNLTPLEAINILNDLKSKVK